MSSHLDPQTGLEFPEYLGGWRAADDMRYHGGPGGVSLSYVHDKGFQASVYVYNNGELHIPRGISSGVIQRHLRALQADITRRWTVVKAFDDAVRRYEGPHDDVEWLCSRYVLYMNDEKQTSWLYLTAWYSHFVKVRHTYPVAIGNTAEPAAEPLMQGLSSILLGRHGA